MNVRDLETLFDYNYWANAKLFAVVLQLSDEEFTRPVTGSYGSVRNTLVHMLSAEWGWLDRCGGAPRGPALVADAYPTPQSVVDQWQLVERDLRFFLSGLRDDDLDRVIEFSIGSGAVHRRRLGDLMQHAANHGVHHRGQVALLLRALGHAPGNVDFLFYEGPSRATPEMPRP